MADSILNPWELIPKTLPTPPGFVGPRRLATSPKEVWDNALKQLPTVSTTPPQTVSQQNEVFRQDLLKTPLAKVPGFVADVARATPRNVASFALDIGGGIMNTPPEKTTITPRPGLEQTFLGSEPIKAMSQRQSEAQQAGERVLNKYNIATPDGAKALSAGFVGPFMGALIGADAWIGGGEGNMAKKIAASTDKKEILSILNKLIKGKTESELASHADELVKITKPQEVADYLGSIVAPAIKTVPIQQVESSIPEIVARINPNNPKVTSLVDAYKAGRDVPPIPVFEKDGAFFTNKDGDHRLFAAKQSGVPEVNIKIEPATDLTGTQKQTMERAVQDKTQIIDKAGNIRLDKIESAEDVKQIIKTTAQAYAPQIDEARRGVIHQAQTEKMAIDLGFTPGSVKARKIGQAWNAEELKAAGDLMVKSAENVRVNGKAFLENETDESLATYLISLNEHAMLQASVSGAKAESGRALAIQKLSLRSPQEPAQAMFDRVIQQYGGKEIGKDIAKKLAEARRAAESTGDYSGYYGLIRNINKPAFKDKIYEFWLNSVLSGPLTHVVNITSNLYQGTALSAQKIVQAAVELPRGQNRDVTFGEAGHYIMGSIKGMVDGVARGLRVLRYGMEPTLVGKLDFTRVVPAIGGKVGTIIRLPTRALSAEDEFFKAMSGTAELYTQAYRAARKEGLKGRAMLTRAEELILDPSEEMMKNVKKTELSATFQQDLGNIGKKVMQFRNSVPGLRYIIPFVKTPTNIFKEALRTSPLGFLEAGQMMYKGAPGEEITKSVAKAAFGSAIGAGLMLIHRSGNLVGSVPDNPSEREAFYNVGKRPYSIKIGDKWVSFARVEPFATLLGAVADISDGIDRGENVNEMVLNFVNIVASQAEDKTFLQGLTDLFSLFTHKNMVSEGIPTTARRLLITALSGFEPQALAQGARSVDGIYRDTNDSDFWGQLIKTVKSRTPWLSQSLPAKINSFGEEIKRPGGVITRFISPITSSPESQDPVYNEYDRLHIRVGAPARVRTVGGLSQSKKLEYSTYRQFIKDTGEIGHARILQLIQDPRYAGLKDSEKEDVLRDVITDTRRLVRDASIGDLLLGLAGVKNELKGTAKDQFNTFYSQVILTEEWKKMDDEEKLKMVLNDYTKSFLKQ